MTKTPRTRFLLAIAAVAAIAATAGCAGSGDGDSAMSDTKASRDDAGAVAEAPAAPDAPDGSRADADLQDAAATAPDAEAGKQLEIAGPSVISTGTVSLEAKDVGDARTEVRKVIDKYQGTLAEQETTTGEKGEVTSARLVFRVPSARFADATLDLEGIATLTSSTSSGQDVSTEVVDVEARIRAQRKSVSRIEALLARAESLEQIVTIESQLSSRQAELDALLARQTYLADQTSQSTINVYVQQPDDESDEPEEDTADGFIGGLSDGWDSFVTGFGAVLTVVGFAIPWLLLLALVGIPARILIKRRTRATA
ncbi:MULTISPECIES: DUF4349 domain-containing protein [unclassified Nocardioides]|uniref:DUF4349 domain-containing protein n=1 Tax=unclassified Nocardioides TaxID=2615069 RepID=UPI0006F399B7|nr:MULTISPECIES: DUF4349 domain-containing protein [unclassified Nocardioides]KRA31268.1 hypothetical protein ASD81_17610 [Nocardioides sp. Root614]KRA87889.1 hypothetical protein ASD84_17885 [Nocardioides sp. Root682]